MAEPTLPCPRCKETPGKEFDIDGSGGYYVDCKICHGTGQVPDRSTAAKDAGKLPAPAAGQ
jgi:hypothetical protein